MCQVPAVAAFVIALLPAAALAQVEPVSGPVSADDLTPYAWTYTIVAPGVAKANYLEVLEGFLEADGDPFGGVGAKSQLAAQFDRLDQDTAHDTVVNDKNGHTWVVSAPTAAAEGEPHGLFVFISPKGTVKLAGMAHSCPAMADIRRDLAGTRHLIPETEGAGSQETVVS